MHELAERGVLQGQRGAYISMGEVAEVNVSATLQATIAARIDRLPPEAKHTLSAAAVIGSRFNLDLLTQLGVEPVVADLAAAQFIDQVKFNRQPEYVFHHPLIRAVAYESQLKSDRADVHRRVAAAIEARDPASAASGAEGRRFESCRGHQRHRRSTLDRRLRRRQFLEQADNERQQRDA